MIGKGAPLDTNGDSPRIALTAIFNTHETADDALATLSHITPDSLVFREGSVSHAALHTADNYARLATLRLREGKYTQNAKALIDTIFAERYNSEKPVSVRSRDYFAHLFIGLIKRNCAIIPADHIDIDGTGLPTEEVEWVYQDLRRLVRDITPSNLPTIIEGEVTHTQLVIEGNRLREEGAIAKVSETLGQIATSGAQNIRTTKDGALQAFITYGALHRHSLTRRLERSGFPPASVRYETRGQDPNSLPDLARLEDSSPEERRNAAQIWFSRLLERRS